MRQMLTQMPPSNHASEDIHEKRDIDEASFQADVGNIANPDLIGGRNLKGLQAIHPPKPGCLRRSRGLTANPFDANRKVLFSHQSGNAFIPDGVSLTQ